MKAYTILLAVLWASCVFNRIMGLVDAPHALLAAKGVADIVLFTLCLAGSVEFAFGRRLARLKPGQWRLTHLATLALGGANVILGANAGAPGVQLFMDFVPYLLFAVPVVLLEHERSKA